MIEVKSNIVEVHIFKYVNGELEFLLLKRSDKEIYPGVWQMVTGSINKHEKAYDTALRELKEETAITPQKLWVVPQVNSFYSHHSNQIIMVPVFAALADADAPVKLSEEHVEYRWVKRDEAVKLLAWQGQRRAVETICDYFLNELSLLNFVRIK